MENREKKVDVRIRNYGCVFYPESAPENWRDIISAEHVPVFISPLHDKDMDPQGQPKKPHYHLMVMYEGKKSISQAKEFFSKFGGVGVEKINSVRGYARYLCHMDNPEKAQYSAEDVISFGGADYMACIGLPTDRYKVIKEMMAYCQANDVCSYSDLLEYSAECHFDWFRVLCDNGTVVMKEYLKSKLWTKQRERME